MPFPVSDTLRRDVVAARHAAPAHWAAWRAGAAVTRWRDALERAETAEGAGAAAARLLADGDWVDALFDPLVARLAADPLFDPPFRVSRDALRTSASIDEAPAVSLTATLTSARTMAARPPLETVIFSGRLTVIRFHRAGGARLRRWRAPPIRGDHSSADAGRCAELPAVSLRDGDVVTIDGRQEAHLVTGAGEDSGEDMATLTAIVRLDLAPMMREFSIATGECRQAATLDEGAARSQMLLCLLREAGRDDAGDVFDRATRDPAFFIRWDAMRQWLALDAAAALPRLREMAADDPNAEIRAAARGTLMQVETALARREGQPCPA